MVEQAKAVMRDYAKPSPGDCMDKPPAPISMETDLGTDVFQAIISCKSLPVQEKHEYRIAQEAFNLVVAASSTTAVVLTTATYHLLMDQDNCLAKLKEELGSVMEDPYTGVHVRTLEQLPWLVSVF